MPTRATVPIWISVAVSLLYLGLLPRYDIGAYNDDALYVVAAQALLTGQYHAIQTPSQPITTFPSPGLPMLLVPFIQMVQPHWSLLEYLSVAVTLASIIAFWYLLRLWFTPTPATLLLALFAFNPTTAHFSGILMSEPYYLLFVLGSFLWLNRLLRSEPSYAWAFGFFIGWASLIRPEGAVLLLSVGLALIYARRWRTLRDSMIPALSMVAYFQVRTVIVSHSVSQEYTTDLTACLLHWARHHEAFIIHAGDLFGEIFSQNLFANPWTTPWLETSIQIVGSLIGLAFITLGLVRGSRSAFQSSRALILAMASFSYFYFLVHLFWSPIEPRYLLPLFPFVLIFLGLGFQNVAITPMLRVAALAIVGGVLLVTYSYQNGYALYESIINTPSANLTPTYTYSWLRMKTSQDDVFLSPAAPGIYLYTQRQAINLISAPDEEAFRFHLAQSHIHLILDRPINAVTVAFDGQDTIDPNREWQRIRRWLFLYPSTFREVYHNAEEKTTIYRVKDDAHFFKAYSHYNAALAEFRQGRLNDGLGFLEQSLREEPGLTGALNAYGMAMLATSSHLELAEQRLLRAVQIRPMYPVALLNLSRLYKREGRLDLSRKYLQQSIDASRALNIYETFMPVVKITIENHEVDAGDPSIVD